MWYVKDQKKRTGRSQGVSPLKAGLILRHIGIPHISPWRSHLPALISTDGRWGDSGKISWLLSFWEEWSNFFRKKNNKNNGVSSHYVLTVSATVLSISCTKSHFILIALHADKSRLTSELMKLKLKEIKKFAWGRGGNEQTLVKRYKLPVIRWIVFWDLIHSHGDDN